MRLFGSRMPVWREGVEWWRTSGVCFLGLLSAALCTGDTGSAGIRCNTSTYVPTSRCSHSGFYFGCTALVSFSFLFFFFFYKAGGVISGCVKMSEHDCWSKNVQTRCVSRIINQQLLILGKQSSPQPGCIGLAPKDRLHARVAFLSVFLFFFLLFYFSLAEYPLD